MPTNFSSFPFKPADRDVFRQGVGAKALRDKKEFPLLLETLNIMLSPQISPAEHHRRVHTGPHHLPCRCCYVRLLRRQRLRPADIKESCKRQPGNVAVVSVCGVGGTSAQFPSCMILILSWYTGRFAPSNAASRMRTDTYGGCWTYNYYISEPNMPLTDCRLNKITVSTFH